MAFGSGLSFSAAAQDAMPTPVLDPQEFSAVAIPDNFKFWEHVTWGARTLVNHSDLKEVIPVFGYRSSDVCNSVTFENVLNLSDPKLGALLLNLENLGSGKAVWLSSLEDVCNPRENKDNDIISWNTSVNANPIAWQDAAAEIGNDLLGDSKQSSDGNAQPQQFILTIGHLPDVAEVGSYWWICDIESPPTAINSACYGTLSASPYLQHRNLLQ